MNFIIKLYKILIISGIIYLGIGTTLELIYLVYLKNLFWILLIYPPPGIMNWVKFVPYIGLLLMLIGVVSILAGICLYLKEHVMKLQS